MQIFLAKNALNQHNTTNNHLKCAPDTCLYFSGLIIKFW